jgi:hypothetical protein
MADANPEDSVADLDSEDGQAGRLARRMETRVLARGTILRDGDETRHVDSSDSEAPAMDSGQTDEFIAVQHSDELAVQHSEERVRVDNSDITQSAVRVGEIEQEFESQDSRSYCSCLSRMSDRVSAGVAALVMGVIHGLAGPGGVLGVIPAVQLHDWKLAVLYLGTFCFISTLVMGAFATIYGTLSSKMAGSAARREFWIAMFSSCLSIVVGIVWLVLSPMGKLEDVFG